MLKVFSTAILMGSALVLAACNPIASLDSASDKIETFHENYNEGDPVAMYAMAAPTLKKIASEEDFVKLTNLVRGRLGKVIESERTGFETQATTEYGTITTINLATTFEKGEGTEEFVFVGDGDAMLIDTWKVNSEQLKGSGGKVIREESEAAPAE